MITFIHTADVHFGMENYGRIDPTTGIHTRLLDFERAFSYVIDTALARNIDFFLFTGDAYKTTHPSPTQQRLLLKAFMRLHQAGIPVVIIIGNHDNPLSFGKAHTLELFKELPLSHFYVIAKPASFVLTTKNGPVQIVGIPWPTRNTLALHNTHQWTSSTQITEYISQGVSALIQDFAQKLDPTVPAVLAAHLTVSTGVFSGSEKRAIYGTDPLFLPSQLALKPFDYVALGHLHRHQNLNPQGYPPVVYSGSIERIDFGERNEEKGFCLVTLKQKGSTYYEFIKTPTRSFLQIEVTLTTTESPTDTLLKTIAQYTLNDAVVKIIYYIPPTVQDTVDIAKVQKACSSALYLVGIFPQRHVVPRERRGIVTATMDFKGLLTSYFSAKEHLKDKKDILIEQALAFAQQVEQSHEECT